ncbi:Glycosyltransferase involved in cell wall bisynthesis [Ferrithrix thermotolerans DSM 19514]|uniref:Glycosyltransferase involved in cell wall bisynthesis n=1 Tax=Ferrithrix thermotolerans DSM 19514 TaxID=1121881 RepID=A0A1M4T8K2_9ACTN|nr:glycosyltransferase family 4 protein [Ferrithrix thermotolerans]SHE40704.1 Glycosyltransferase involved in cell wall bisynthesis [Ferrithrix thermotolerans DSM 19514]
MSPKIHQFIPSLSLRDAVGQHTLALQQTLIEAGVESEIYADEMKGEARSFAKSYREFPRKFQEDTYLIYQGSTNSPMASFLSQRHEPVLMNYHNITPAETVIDWDVGTAVALGMAVAEISRLAPHITMAFTVSKFNANDLVRLGYKNIEIAAPFIALSETHPRECKPIKHGAKWLFVGRIVPNKAQHELIKAFATYQRIYDKDAILQLVGNPAQKKYFDFLQAFAAEIGVAESIEFLGSVTDEELSLRYRSSDVFTCTSRHEGFCFPLIEAMRNSMPIVAYASSAIPDTLGRAGVLVRDPDPISFASAVHIALSDSDRQLEFQRGAAEQLERYSIDRAKVENLSTINKVVKSDQLSRYVEKISTKKGRV